MSEYLDRTAEWLRRYGLPAKTVTAVNHMGTDWHGSTEDGFESRFEVDIRWTHEKSGREHSHEVAGAQMASLWAWLVRGEIEGPEWIFLDPERQRVEWMGPERPTDEQMAVYQLDAYHNWTWASTSETVGRTLR